MRIKAIAAALWLAFGGGAYAQASKSTIIAEVNSNLPTNGDAQITASVLRTTLIDFINASNFQADFVLASQIPAISGDCITVAGTTAITCTKTATRPFTPYAYSAVGTGGDATTTGFTAANQALSLIGSLTGTGANYGPYSLLSIADTAGTNAQGFIAGQWIAHNINNGALVGNRAAMLPIMTKNAAVSGTPDPLRQYYIAAFPQLFVNAGDGGTSTSDYRGSHYGIGSLVEVGQAGNATFLRSVQGAEFDVSIHAGSSTSAKNILLLAGVNGDAVKGTDYDGMLSFTTASSSNAKWTYGITFGWSQGFWPFDSTSTLIGTFGLDAKTANHGVDFSAVTFTTSAFKSTGFLVSPTGATTVASLASTGGVSGTTGAFSGAVSGTTGTFSGDVSAPHFKSNVANPAASTCGTSPTIDTGSSNHGGKITFGSATTACTLTFASAFPTNAYCTVTPMAQPAAVANIPYISAQSRTAFTISGGTASAVYQYNCQGN